MLYTSVAALAVAAFHFGHFLCRILKDDEAIWGWLFYWKQLCSMSLVPPVYLAMLSSTLIHVLGRIAAEKRRNLDETRMA